MSTKPGIGYDAMWDVASVIMDFNLADGEADVPSALRHGSRELPLGTYLQRSLRKMVGKDEKAPQSTLDAMEEKVRPMRQAAFDASRSFKEEVMKEGEQRALNQETRRKIRKQRRKL